MNTRWHPRLSVFTLIPTELVESTFMAMVKRKSIVALIALFQLANVEVKGVGRSPTGLGISESGHPRQRCQTLIVRARK